MSARLQRSDVVRVTAETLGNGAPHPFTGRTGVVLEVRRIGLHPVRVHVDGQPGRPGRTVMFAPDELARELVPDGGIAGQGR